MKIGIIGDTHKEISHIDKALEYFKDCALILHTGDNFSDSRYIYEKTNINTIGVVGNCDGENAEDEILFEVENNTLFLCHGHKYDVKFGIKHIKKRGKELGADMVIFGHSHEFTYTQEDNMIFLNPGSTALPRGKRERSCMILKIDKENIEVEEITF